MTFFMFNKKKKVHKIIFLCIIFFNIFRKIWYGSRVCVCKAISIRKWHAMGTINQKLISTSLFKLIQLKSLLIFYALVVHFFSSRFSNIQLT